jgi:hypothetical protein
MVGSWQRDHDRGAAASLARGFRPGLEFGQGRATALRACRASVDSLLQRRKRSLAAVRRCRAEQRHPVAAPRDRLGPHRHLLGIKGQRHKTDTSPVHGTSPPALSHSMKASVCSQSPRQTWPPLSSLHPPGHPLQAGGHWFESGTAHSYERQGSTAFWDAGEQTVVPAIPRQAPAWAWAPVSPPAAEDLGGVPAAAIRATWAGTSSSRPAPSCWPAATHPG